jgi:DNA mismatch repair protein MutL
MSARVRVLPDDLANQIAAGEVVERPASVAKELIENAIDAGGRRVSVEIEQGGVALVRVSDDGGGMSREDASLAVLRHATSKLAAIDDLLSLESFGFRGEALPSIASVSRFSLRTRRREDEEGSLVRVEGGASAEVTPTGAAPGTVVEVRDLFFNVPARRKFLKATGTESARVTEVVQCAALSQPEVALFLTRDGRAAGEWLRASSREERARSIFAGEELAACRGARGPLVVEAFLSRPERARPGATSLYLFVNGRPVRDRLLSRSVALAYGSVLEPGRYPIGVVYLDLPADRVDVNVHPQKAEVRFADARAVGDALFRVVAGSVAAAFGVPGRAQGAPPAGILADLPPSMGGLPAGSLAASGAQDERPLPHPSRPSPARSEPYGDDAPPFDEAGSPRAAALPAGGAPHPYPRFGGRSASGALDLWNRGFEGGKRATSPAALAARDEANAPWVWSGASGREPPGGSAPASNSGSSPAAPSDPEAPRAPPSAGLSGAPSGARASEEASDPWGLSGGEAKAVVPYPTAAEIAARDRDRVVVFGALRFVAQVRSMFLICEGSDGLYLLDQHAAAERVTFYRLRRGYDARAVPRQTLLFPVIVAVSPSDVALVEEAQEAIGRMGIEVRAAGEASVAVHAVPALLPRASPEQLLRDLIGEVGHAGERAFSGAIDRAIATMACHGSLRAGDPVPAAEAQALLASLDEVDFAGHCPHGRPVVMRIAWGELEHRVGRR